MVPVSIISGILGPRIPFPPLTPHLTGCSPAPRAAFQQGLRVRCTCSPSAALLRRGLSWTLSPVPVSPGHRQCLTTAGSLCSDGGCAQKHPPPQQTFGSAVLGGTYLHGVSTTCHTISPTSVSIVFCKSVSLRVYTLKQR